jgi:hypothetical protein
MLNKLMENILKNPALKNQHVRNQFKLHLIRDEQDLHQYKNLLNAMAALFYTNHTPQDMSKAFSGWRKAL